MQYYDFMANSIAEEAHQSPTASRQLAPAEEAMVPVVILLCTLCSVRHAMRLPGLQHMRSFRAYCTGGHGMHVVAFTAWPQVWVCLGS